MSRKRTIYTAAFKRKLVLEVLANEKSLSKLPKLGWIKFRKSRELEGKLKSAVLGSSYSLRH